MPSEVLDLVDRFRGLAADLPWPVLLGAALAVLLLVGAIRRRAGRPRAGEIWSAQVPFRDRTGSKDRPILVLSVGGRTCTVAQFTSQDRDARRDFLRVPDGFPGLSRSSWVSLRPVRVRRSAIRRRSGTPGMALVGRYEDAAR